MKRTLLFTLLAASMLAAGLASAESDSPFPRPAELEPAVQFWIRIYSEVDTSGGLIHDSRNLGVVYEVVRVPAGLSSRARERRTEKAKKRYRAILQKLARGRRSGLSAEESRVLGLWPPGVSNETLGRAARRVRFQLGQADKFRAGLIRSGAWEPHIRETFSEMGLPEQLAALPHVESSYTPHAYSRVGAAGLWQFTRSTGRRFMRVDHIVDERLDPFVSTIAAARLLKQNREVTGSWPLAITAYNHGAAGMRRAARKLGTRDIATVVRDYRSRTFGFASRNFYVEFLAAAEVDFHSEKYFGTLLLDAPVEYAVQELPFYVHARDLASALGIDRRILEEANPALRSGVWQGAKYVPKKFPLRIPVEHLSRPLAALIEEVPAAKRAVAQKRDTYHRVRRGETLSSIASRYRVRMSELVALNNLRSRHRIRAGQRLRLPLDGRNTRLAAVSTPREPAPAPIDGIYRVRRGDTLEGIANRFGMGTRELASANGLRNRNRIYVGQKLRVADTPAAEKPTPQAAPTPPVPIQVARVPEEAVAATPASPAADEIGVVAVDDAAPTEAELNEQKQALAADPSDYSVHADGSIEVQATETLGHYAEWLDLRASRLRQLNRMKYGQPLAVGRRIRLDFSRVPSETFESRRLRHHRDLQEAFFERFEIAGTSVHVMRRGDSLWTLSQRDYRVPLWLLRQYNPDLDFGALHAGTRVTVPRVRAHQGT